MFLFAVKQIDYGLGAKIWAGGTNGEASEVISDKDKLIMESLVAKQTEGCLANLSRLGSQ